MLMNLQGTAGMCLKLPSLGFDIWKTWATYEALAIFREDACDYIRDNQFAGLSMYDLLGHDSLDDPANETGQRRKLRYRGFKGNVVVTRSGFLFRGDNPDDLLAEGLDTTVRGPFPKFS